MEKQKTKITLAVTALALVATALALTTATYAWFTFSPYTNVTPMEGKISEGDTNLLISANKAGPFEKTCTLQPVEYSKAMKPVSTANLSTFYTSLQQKDGFITTYRDVSKQLDQYLIHGTVYLQNIGKKCDVLFDRKQLSFGTDNQLLAAGRLALKITGEGIQEKTLFLRLDSMGSTSGAASRQTVKEENVVVSGIDGAGAGTFQKDPSEPIDGYFSENTGGKSLCVIQSDAVVSVEYWLYLEGCDKECCNEVQNRDVALQLAFYGEPTEE